MRKQLLSESAAAGFAGRMQTSRIFMLTIIHGAAILAALRPSPNLFASEWARLSPFTNVHSIGRSTTVCFDGKEYHLVSINDVVVERLLAHCHAIDADSPAKRFTEDLVEVLHGIGAPMTAGQTVKLVLKEPATGNLVVVDRAPMTRENRDELYRQRHLNVRGGAPEALPTEEEDLPAALDHFEQVLREQWSYYKVGAADFPAAMAGLREKVRAGLDANSFALELEKIIALGIDGHARVSGYRLPDGYLPFLIETSQDRLVALKPDRSGLLDASHPFLARLDGRNMADWLKAAAAVVPQGSPQYVRRGCLRQLRHIQFVRQEMGLPQGGDVAVELESPDGGSKRKLQMKVTTRYSLYGVWPRHPSQVLEGNVGYLRIARMNDEALAQIDRWMPQFRHTDGLIVDVRGNGGGSREALRRLYSYLVLPDSPPKVANAAIYRLAPQFAQDHLESRFMYRGDSPVWNEAEREAITAFRRTFRPQWEPRAGEFSDWHYLVLSPLGGDGIFHYAKPIVVLMDEHCFSATDIFLAGLKGSPQVTLMGTPSSGGSARVVDVKLRGCSIELTLGSMVSFQPDGKLFDGHGVTPDVLIEPAPEYFIGGRDNVLESARQHLRSVAR